MTRKIGAFVFVVTAGLAATVAASAGAASVGAAAGYPLNDSETSCFQRSSGGMVWNSGAPATCPGTRRMCWSLPTGGTSEFLSQRIYGLLKAGSTLRCEVRTVDGNGSLISYASKPWGALTSNFVEPENVVNPALRWGAHTVCCDMGKAASPSLSETRVNSIHVW
jgi:hypothetical protein